MWRPSPDEPEEDDAAATGAPEPTGPSRHIEPSGRALTERAAQRAGDLAAVERLAAEINKSLAEYARKLKYDRERDR